jgi:hypothetical protein
MHLDISITKVCEYYTYCKGSVLGGENCTWKRFHDRVRAQVPKVELVDQKTIREKFGHVFSFE